MSADPTPAEELSMIQQQKLMTEEEVGKLIEQAFNARLDLFERQFKEIARAEIERADETRSRVETEAKWKRLAEWQNQFLAALAGFVLCFVLATGFSQCSDLHNRLSTLESKERK